MTSYRYQRRLKPAQQSAALAECLANLDAAVDAYGTLPVSPLEHTARLSTQDVGLGCVQLRATQLG